MLTISLLPTLKAEREAQDIYVCLNPHSLLSQLLQVAPRLVLDGKGPVPLLDPTLLPDGPRLYL